MGGSSQSTSVKIPAWLENAGKALLTRANDASRIGYTPYYGPDVAAMTPAQVAAMQGTNQAALSFGVPMADFNAGLPQAQNFDGMSAYSSGGMFDDALAALKAARPGQYNAIMGQFIDPILGNGPALSLPAPGAPVVPGSGNRDRRGNRNGEGGSYTAAPTTGGATVGGGYTGLRDMFNGGGPGASGPDFQGGLLSAPLNRMGIQPIGQGGGGGMGRSK